MNGEPISNDEHLARVILLLDGRIEFGEGTAGELQGDSYELPVIGYRGYLDRFGEPCLVPLYDWSMLLSEPRL